MLDIVVFKTTLSFYSFISLFNLFIYVLPLWTAKLV